MQALVIVYKQNEHQLKSSLQLYTVMMILIDAHLADICRAALILDFTDTSSTKYCCLMYSQVQVLVPIHGYTIECVVKINFIFAILA